MKLFTTDKNELHQGTIHMNGNSTYEELQFVLDFLHNFAKCGKSKMNQVTRIGEETISGTQYKVIDIRIDDQSFKCLDFYRQLLPINFISWRV